MSFLTDVLAAVGGSPSVLLVRYRGVGQTVVGGELQTWDDARGASGYGPTATGYGAPKPAVDVNGVVSCDGVQNHYSTGMQAIFDQTTPGTWIYLGIVPNNSVAIVMDSEPSTGYPNLDAIVGTGGRIEGYFSDGTSRGLTADGLQIVMKYWAGSSPSGGAHAGDSWKMLEVRGHVPSRPTNEGANPGLYGPKAYRIGDWTNGPGFHAATQEYFSMWVDHALSATEKTNLVALLKAEFPTAFIDTSKGYIIPDGDSRVAGATLADPVTEAWPAKMMVTLGLSATYEMMNAGVSSRSTATARTAFNKRLGGFYDASRTLHQIVMVSGSFINSLSEGATAASILADLIAHCTEARDLGNKVIVTTELPWVGGAGYPASDVNAHNAYIRAHRAEFADELADFALILTDPTDPTDWSDDQKHPNASGHNKLANTAVYGAAAAVTRLLSSLPPISGTGQGRLSPLVGAGTTRVLVGAHAQTQLSPLVGAGTARTNAQATGSAILSPLVGAGQAHVMLRATGAGVLSALMGFGSQQLPNLATGAGRLASFISTGQLRLMLRAASAGFLKALVGHGGWAPVEIVHPAGAATLRWVIGEALAKSFAFKQGELTPWDLLLNEDLANATSVSITVRSDRSTTPPIIADGACTKDPLVVGKCRYTPTEDQVAAPPGTYLVEVKAVFSDGSERHYPGPLGFGRLVIERALS
jgi:hypothetical protein